MQPRGAETESQRFHRLATERDLYAAYGVLLGHRARLFEHLRRRFGGALGGDVPVELVVEEALERARDWAFRYDPAKGSLWSWLKRIGENRARDRMRVPTRVRTGARLDDVPRAEPVTHLLDELREAVAALSRAERVILLARYRGHPFPDRRLSRHLGWTVGHIRNVRSRVLRGLRERLGGAS